MASYGETYRNEMMRQAAPSTNTAPYAEQYAAAMGAPMSDVAMTQGMQDLAALSTFSGFTPQAMIPQASAPVVSHLPTQPATVLSSLGTAPPPLTASAPQVAAPYTTGAPAVVMPAGGVTTGEFSPMTYTTNGGRSSTTGGYGSGSQLAAFAMAHRYGMTPAQMQQQKDEMAVAGARNSPIWNQLYQDTLSQTGNPNLAKSNADFQLALGTDGSYPSSFAAAAQDDALRRGLSAQDQINAAAMIDPNAASVNQNRFVPGGHVVGATTEGQPLYQATPGAETTVLPMGGAVLPAISSGQIGARQRQADFAAQARQGTSGRDLFADRLRLEQGQTRLDNTQLNNVIRNAAGQINNYIRAGQAVPPELQLQYDAAVTQQAESAGIDAAATTPRIQF